MRKLALLFSCFIGFLSFVNAQTTPLESQSHFEDAYSRFPNIPRGTLEAMAYGATRLGNIIPDEGTHHHHGPDRYGLFGLIADGEGYFDNTLSEVMAYAPEDFSTDAFIHNQRAQILCVAERISNLCLASGVQSVEGLAPVLKEFCEIPSDNEANRYAQELYVYEVYTHLTQGIATPVLSVKPVTLSPENWFHPNNYEILRSPNVTISDQGITNGRQMYDPSGNAPLPMSVDYPPALWSASNNYSSRNGTTISAVTIHTTQGSYSGAISWLKNPSANASAHYVLRSSDGQITQLVLEVDKAWHVGSENPYTIGLEHEGFVSQTGWYTTAMYNASAALVRDICTDRNINPTTCYSGASGSTVNVLSSTVKIKGHQHFPNQTHTDPGINWDWPLFYNLVNNNNTCNAPSGLSAGNITPNSVRLSWGSASGASAYLLKYKTNAATTWTQVTVTSINYLLSGLAPNTTYNWQVASVCGGSTSSFTGGTNFTTMASSSASCTGTITDSGLTGNYGNNENWTYTIAPAGATAVSLTFNSFGLENTYDFLYLYNGPTTASPLIGTYTGTGSPGTVTGTGGALTLRFVSDGATVSWGFTANWSCTLPPVCAQATGLSVSGITTSGATLNWNAVSGATSYTLKYKPVSAATWSSITPTANSYTLSGLTSGTQYQWSLATNCTSGSSAEVTGPLFTTSLPCSAPTTLSTSGITNSSATLNWNVITPATSYTVEIKPTNGTSWISYTATSNSYTVTGLTALTQYEWKIKTNCSGGSSPSSSAVQTFTTLAPPCNTPGSLSASSVSYTSASINWGAVSGAVSYLVQWKTSAATSWSSATVTGTTYALSGLTQNTVYNWRVTTNCASNTSAVTATQSFTTLSPPCNTPGSLSASSVSYTSASINWGAVSGTVSYLVQWKTSAATSWSSATVTGTTYALSGLTQGTVYNWRVTTNCASNTSAVTATQSFTTLSCTTPATATTSYVSTSVATLNWTTVGGATGYSLEYKTAAATSWTAVSTTSNTYTITGLAASTQYQYRVRTQCASGVFSGYTATGTFTTQATCYDAWESNNSSGTATAIASGTSKYGKICSSASDVDWFKVTITATSSITFTLTQVPVDYDLEAYTSVFLSGSYNSGTNSETITLSNRPAGTYYFRVISGSGTFSSTLDYKVTATVTPSAQGGHSVTDIEPESLQSLAVSLFPNPAGEAVYLKTGLQEGVKNLKIKILNLNGSIVLTQTESYAEPNDIISLPIENLPEGMYLLMTESEDYPMPYVQKFVIKH